MIDKFTYYLYLSKLKNEEYEDYCNLYDYILEFHSNPMIYFNNLNIGENPTKNDLNFLKFCFH